MKWQYRLHKYLSQEDSLAVKESGNVIRVYETHIKTGRRRLRGMNGVHDEFE